MAGRWTQDEIAKIDAMIEPTPHEAYVQNVTPQVVERIANSIKSQAMKDYINALSKLRDDPHSISAQRVVHECEDFFDDAGKLQTVKRKVKYDGGLFEIICQENFPGSWGEALPTGKDAIRCPICKEGHINRTYRPVDPSKPKQKKDGKDPHIIYSCDVCTYKYISYPGRTDDITMQKAKNMAKEIALIERDRLCRQEIHDELQKHPEWTQREKDLCYQRYAKKWHV